MSSAQPVLIEGIPAGLTVREVPGCDGRRFSVADWLCACGVHERATGRQAVQQLLARVRVGHCPHRQEASAA